MSNLNLKTLYTALSCSGTSLVRSIRRSAKLLLIAAAFTSMVPANAAGAWYRGEIERVFVFSAGFVLMFKSAALDDCMHDYVYFRTDEIDVSIVDRAYALALSAQSQGKSVGVVIDKAINGNEGLCYASGSIDMYD